VYEAMHADNNGGSPVLSYEL